MKISIDDYLGSAGTQTDLEDGKTRNRESETAAMEKTKVRYAKVSNYSHEEEIGTWREI